MRKISETRCTCSACGNVWHYGKSDEIENFGNSMANAGKAMMCCTGCFPALLIPDKKVQNLKEKCPKCGSRAIKAEKITHEVK